MNPLFRFSTGLVVALVVLVACGGGGGGTGGSSSTGTTSAGSSNSDTGPGQASISIDWPERDRALPTAANSVVLSVVKDGKVLKTSLVARPDDGSSSVVSFTGLPLGTLSIQISAYVTATGTGAVLSVGTMPCTPVAGPPTPVPVTVPLPPVPATLVLSSSALSLPKGASASLSLNALDATGSAVSVAADALKWTSDGPSIAAVSGTGTSVTVTGVSVGTTTIHASLTVPGLPPIGVSGIVTVSGTGGTVTVK